MITIFSMKLHLNEKNNFVELTYTTISLPFTGVNQIRPSLSYCRFEHVKKDGSSIVLEGAYKDNQGNFYDSDFQRITFSGNQVTGTLEYAVEKLRKFCPVPEYSDNGLVPTKIIFDGKVKFGKNVHLIVWDFLNTSVVTGLYVDEYGRFYTKQKEKLKIKAHMLRRTLTIKK